MDFQPQKIVIQTKEGPQTIDAMVGIGSGLAYHLEYEDEEENHEEDEEDKDEAYMIIQLPSGEIISNRKFSAEDEEKVYTLVHLSSGLSFGEYGVDDEDVAQRWLELVASLVDWNQDLATLNGQLSRNLRDQVYAAIDQAYIDVFGDPDEEEEAES